MFQTTTIPQAAHTRLNIVHCLRAPVGGLFRHVLDLASQQAKLGHRVGIICAAGGDSLTETRLLSLTPQLQLGLHRLAMGRDVGLGDINAYRQVLAIAHELDVDVLHGHGAKGGAYARLAVRWLKASGDEMRCFYTPHGGSLHYPPTSLQGKFYGGLERRLEAFTDGVLFESQFAADKYAHQIGQPRCATKVVVNGIKPDEFEDVRVNDNAADFVFVGELRHLKGVDVALNALSQVQTKRAVTAVFVGDGPDAAVFKAQAKSLGLEGFVTFPGAMRARDAFVLGRVLLMPSRAESLPYIVLEAIGAGVPILASNVGGIPEIIPPTFDPLLPPGDADALATRMLDVLVQPVAARIRALNLRNAIRAKFSVQSMASGITAFYAQPAAQDRAA